jgi:hypothetical protein
MDIPATTLFEQEVLSKLLEGDDDVLCELRVQLAHATITSRKMTGVGFFLDFSIPEHLGRLTDHYANIKPNFCFGDVGAQLDGLKYGAGFLLWITDGRLDSLEGYSYEGPWPPSIKRFQLHYFSEPRDVHTLRENWLRGTD